MVHFGMKMWQRRFNGLVMGGVTWENYENTKRNEVRRMQAIRKIQEV